MLLVFLACVGPYDDVVAEPAMLPTLELSPNSIEFGAVEVGESARVYVQLSNTGEGDLHLVHLELVDQEGSFELGAPSSVLVPPGQTSTFAVQFEPLGAGYSEDGVRIVSDASNASQVLVPLYGEGMAPVLDLDPMDPDLGIVELGCVEQLPVLLSNHGSLPLEVDGLEFSSDTEELWFSADEEVHGALPWTLSPNETRELWLVYEPLSETTALGELLVTSDAPQQSPLRSSVTATGQAASWGLDSFDVPAQPPVDMILALDWSPSMMAGRWDVLGHIGSLVDALDDTGVDYQMAVTTQDDGCIVHLSDQPAWLTADQHPKERLANAEFMICGHEDSSSCIGGGSYSERAFMLFEAALSSTNTGAGGCNEGLLRDEAQLVLVGISDEPEQSVNPYTYYVSLFQSMKSDSDDVVIHGIGGDYPTGCDSARAYTGLYEATVATGGTLFSICSDLDTSFGQLADATGGLPWTGSFELSAIPAAATLEVQVDGALKDEGWVYNEVDNTVDFSEPVEPGATVQIRYALMGTCP
jgi:hypothetical protein